MKHHMSAAGVALTLLAGIAGSGPAAAGELVPFRGSLEGQADVSAFPAVVVEATGSATQLGQFTYTEPHVVDPATRTGSGTFTFVAANGDTIFGTVVGVATVVSPPNLLSIEEHATITGGTGRFAGATGGFTVRRLYDNVSLVTSGSFEGTVSAPGAGG